MGGKMGTTVIEQLKKIKKKVGQYRQKESIITKCGHKNFWYISFQFIYVYLYVFLCV